MSSHSLKGLGWTNISKREICSSKSFKYTGTTTVLLDLTALGWAFILSPDDTFNWHVTRRKLRPLMWQKVWQKCSHTHMFGMVSSLTCVQPTWPLQWAGVHQKEVTQNCWKKLTVRRVVHLTWACWLAHHGLSLKYQQHADWLSQH